MRTNIVTAQVILKPGGRVVIKMWINRLFLIPLPLKETQHKFYGNIRN